jgi:hypothetical protein
MTTRSKRLLRLREAESLMRVGHPLMQMHTPTGKSWFIVPGGEVSNADAKTLLERPDVQPNQDGLFPGISQTWKVRSIARPLGENAPDGGVP